MARLSSVIFERAQRKRKNDDVRVKFLFIVGSGINASKMVCACKHFNCVVSVASTVNAARLVTHLTQQCPKAPGIIKEIAQQSTQGAKKKKKWRILCRVRVGDAHVPRSHHARGDPRAADVLLGRSSPGTPPN